VPSQAALVGNTKSEMIMVVSRRIANAFFIVFSFQNDYLANAIAIIVLYFPAFVNVFLINMIYFFNIFRQNSRAT